MSVFVINERVSSCCGQPTGRCTCRGQHIRNIQPTHQPLGIPVWNFGNETAQQPEMTSSPGIVFNYGKERPLSGGLGLPVWDFQPRQSAAAQAPEKPVGNQRVDGKPEPLGLPAWNFEPVRKQ